MRTVKIKFPQMVFETREIQVSDDYFPEDLAAEDQVAFILSKMSDFEKECLPTNSPSKYLYRVMDWDACSIKEVKHLPEYYK